MIGFAGDAIICQNIADLIMNPANQYIVSALFVENIILFIEQLFEKNNKDIKCGFIVSGIGKNGEICVGNVSTYQPKSIYYPRINGTVYQGIYPQEIPRNANYYSKFLSQQPPMEATISTIKLCAKLSPSVNTVCFHQTVVLENPKVHSQE